LKKGFLTVFVLSVAAFLPAQIVTRGKQTISVGYGYPNLQKSVLNLLSYNENFKSKGYGPLHFRYENAISEELTLGASVNLTNYGCEWSDSGYRATLTVTAYSGLFRMNCFFFNEENLKVYGGVAFGYRGRTSTYTNARPGNTVSQGVESVLTAVAVPIGFETTLGIRGRLGNGVGGYVEFGLAKSVIQAGLYFDF
jgi:hypothetical protein